MYCELEIKTNYSFLRGASHPEEFVRRAAELGLPAIALSDHDGVYGIPKAYWEKKNHSSLKLITGASVSLPEGQRLTLLARHRQGYGLLCRLLTKSHEGKEKGKAELSWDQLSSFLQEAAAEGLIALTPANGNIPLLRPLFAPDRLYLTLNRFCDGHDRTRTEKALWLSRRFSLPLVATNDVHYHLPARSRLQDALTSIREGAPLQKLGHKLFPNAARHLKCAAEMKLLFHDQPEAIANTALIASACSFCPSELSYRYPSEWIPAGHSAQSYLTELTWAGAATRYPGGIPEDVGRQLRHELRLIEELNYPDYFLTIYDVVVFAKEKKILCQGRGAAANSAVCYCLGITAIDPVRMNLLFERFISLERNEPPDIDVDFEHERREEVLQYVYEKYGRHRAAMVSAVVTYQPRSALREVAKALGLHVGTLSAKKLEKEFESLAADSETLNARSLAKDLAAEMGGFPRHLSIHSGGFTLSADPITEIVPVEPARMPGRTIVQWDKYDLDYLGLMKVDLLSLGMLSAIRRCLDLTGKELHTVPADDGPTYAMIQKADTVGTFQIESRAQMSMLGRLLPKNFYDLVIEVAIVRPGPIVGKMVHPYLRRRRGEEKIVYPHPKLKEILGRTLGVPLFQEQVMKMAVELAGFTPGESDQLRRAIGAWRSQGSLEGLGKKLAEGLRRSGLSQDYTDRIFEQIKGFAQYGFPESHAASFALLAYVSCYLKCHHPAEFTASLLNSLPMGFYAAHTLVDDAKLHGVEVAAVHPNESSWECETRKGKIQLGWNMVNGLGKEKAGELASLRPFSSLTDFLRRTHLKRDVLLRLALGGAFQCFGFEPRPALWQVLEFHRRNTAGASAGSQGDLFLDSSYARESQTAFASPDDLTQIREEYNAFSLSTHGHPMSALRRTHSLPSFTTQTAKGMSNGRVLSVSGLILVRQRPPTAKGMTFSTLEDEFGFLDIAIPPQTWERVKPVFLAHCFLIVTGKLQRETNSYSLLVHHLKPLFPEDQAAKNLTIEPTQYFH